MGLGKTVQSLAIASAYRSEWPLLIVTQLSLRCTWREAILMWLGPCLNLTSADIYSVESLNDAINTLPYVWSQKPITLFTYDLLSRYVEKAGASCMKNFKVIIMVGYYVNFFEINNIPHGAAWRELYCSAVLWNYLMLVRSGHVILSCWKLWIQSTCICEHLTFYIVLKHWELANSLNISCILTYLCRWGKLLVQWKNTIV